MREPLVDCQIGKEVFKLVVPTDHNGDAVVFTAIHRQTHDRRIGGMRFVPLPDGKSAEEYGMEEVGHLASAMTYKCAAAGISADGQKTVAVALREGVLSNPKRMMEILTEHIRTVLKVDKGVIFGPDMNVDEAVQDELSQVDGFFDHITGLSRGKGGLSIDENGFTGDGMAESLDIVYGTTGVRGRTATVQGFGAVGARMATRLLERGAVVRAVSNETGVLVSLEASGLDVGALRALAMALGKKDVKACLRLYARSHPERVRFSGDPDDLFAVPTEIFVPAARTSILEMPAGMAKTYRTENPDVQDATVFLRRTGVRTIVEGANYPLSEDAEAFMEEQGVLILTDFIVNCGGLIGCWVEWEERHRSGTRRMLGEEVERRARDWVRRTVAENVPRLTAFDPPRREAAIAMAKARSGAFTAAETV